MKTSNIMVFSYERYDFYTSTSWFREEQWVVPQHLEILAITTIFNSYIKTGIKE